MTLTRDSLLFSPTRDGVPSSDDNFTAGDLVAAQDALEAEARDVLPFAFGECTYDLGPLKQPVSDMVRRASADSRIKYSSMPASLVSATRPSALPARFHAMESTNWWNSSIAVISGAIVAQNGWVPVPAALYRLAPTRRPIRTIT